MRPAFAFFRPWGASAASSQVLVRQCLARLGDGGIQMTPVGSCWGASCGRRPPVGLRPHPGSSGSVKQVGRLAQAHSAFATSPSSSRSVKKVARLALPHGLAKQPDSPSGQAGWGLVSFSFVFSRSTSFTIRASRMGLRGLGSRNRTGTRADRQFRVRPPFSGLRPSAG
jgi:hypothetical protein